MGDHPLSETLLACSWCFHTASSRVGEAARLMPGVTKIMIQVSQKMVLSPLKINIFLIKLHHQWNHVDGAAVPLVVEIFSNIDFQMRYDHFSETPVSLFSLHYVPGRYHLGTPHCPTAMS